MTAGPDGPIGADFLQLDPGVVPARELGAWLTAQLRAAVLDGRLADGARLPATRTLARDLGLARGTVVEAYQRLTEEGLIAARVGAGTRVITPRTPVVASRPPGAGDGTPGAGPGTPGAGRLVGRWAHHGPVPGSDGDTVEFDLWPGVPDLTAFPRAAWLRAESAVLAGAGAAELGYGEPAGHVVLRRELAAWLARSRGVRAHPDDIVVVAGVAQALVLVTQVLRARGHASIAIEEPGSWGVRDTLVRGGLTPVGIPVDDHGLDVAALTATNEEAVVVTPAHQFPTGVVLAPDRRRELITWAAGRNALVVEDDYDAEYRYDRRPVPALHAGAPQLVIHTGSTSKTLAPGLRLGWAVVPRHLRAALVEAKYAADISNPTLTQLTFAKFLADGAFERHLRLARRRQRLRRDALLDGLRDLRGRGRVHGVPAGLHLLLTLDDGVDGVDEADLVARLAANGVRAQPLSMHRTRPGPPGLVLGYSAVSPERLREAARRITDALR